MNQKSYRMSTLKHRIKSNKDPKKMWVLNKAEKEYLETIGYEVIFALYKIPTRKTGNYKTTSKIVREIHNAKQREIPYIFKKQLNFSEKNDLGNCGIKYQQLYIVQKI